MDFNELILWCINNNISIKIASHSHTDIRINLPEIRFYAPDTDRYLIKGAISWDSLMREISYGRNDIYMQLKMRE